MRDPARIKHVLAAVEKVWTIYPDLRFGQLVYALFHGKDMFVIEDDKFQQMIDDFITSHVTKS